MLIVALAAVVTLAAADLHDFLNRRPRRG